ncbi:hypothetical protein BC829DRAFT_394624 [Chytridium lagenaria]|nr:hypothetical protein BC829DRAFT_394624 [Chytridium lagenaria]
MNPNANHFDLNIDPVAFRYIFHHINGHPHDDTLLTIDELYRLVVTSKYLSHHPSLDHFHHLFVLKWRDEETRFQQDTCMWKFGDFAEILKELNETARTMKELVKITSTSLKDVDQIDHVMDVVVSMKEVLEFSKGKERAVKKILMMVVEERRKMAFMSNDVVTIFGWSFQRCRLEVQSINIKNA